MCGSWKARGSALSPLFFQQRDVKELSPNTAAPLIQKCGRWEGSRSTQVNPLRARLAHAGTSKWNFDLMGQQR